MRKELFLAVALLAAFATTSSAGVIELDFISKGSLGRNMNGVTAHFSGGGTYSGWAGLLKIDVTGDTTPFGYGGIQEVYCTELNEFAGRNDDYFLDTLDNLSIPTTAPHMAIGQKTAIEKLFSIAETVSTNFEAAGFQVAVWEISQDVDFGNLTNPNAGNFYLSGSGDNYDGILASANGFLSQLHGLNRVSVLGMVSPGSQDFVDANPSPAPAPSTVPEPATLALWSVGLIGLGLRRRRA